MRRARPLLAALTTVLVIGAAVSCRDPTEVTVEITTDIRCPDMKGVTLTVGNLSDLDQRPVTTATNACDPATLRIGAIVIVPSGDDDETVAVRVVMGFGRDPAECVPPAYGPGCIVARRALRYIPHTRLTIPIFMSAQCNGIACGATETCVKGDCHPATIDDSTACIDGCGENSLPEGGPGNTPTDGGGSPDGRAGDAALGSDGPAPDGTTGPGVPKVGQLASATVANGTGLAQQTHLVYAVGSARWWLFTIDPASPTLLKTRSSPDFATWTDGATLTLPYPHLNEGRSFSVASKTIAGIDVIHLAIAARVSTPEHRRFHSRATVNGTTIAFSAPIEVNALLDGFDGSDPDATVTVIGGDNKITDLSGWTHFQATVGIDNSEAYRSTSADLGASWTAGWNVKDELERVITYVHARAAVPLGAASVLAFWENGAAEPNPNNITFSRWDGVAWTLAGPAFATVVDQHVNDWSVLKLSNTDVHLVRRSLIGTYDHRRFDGTTWKNGAAIPTALGVMGSGLVLAASGANVILLAIAADSTVRYAKWSPGGAQGSWGPWTAFEASAATRSNLAGYSSAADGHAAVVWIEPQGATFRIVGSVVPAL